MGMLSSAAMKVLETETLKRSLGDAAYLVREFISPNTREVSHAQDFLSAPWPQPSPHLPGRLAPAVLHVPQPEIKHFLDTVVARYIRTLKRRWPHAARVALSQPNAKIPSDQNFISLFVDSTMGQFITPLVDEADRRRFAPFLEGEDPGSFYKIDISHLDRLKSFSPDIYCAPTVTLLQKVGGTFRPKAIQCGEHLFTPEDRDAWSLAKLFVVQGAGIHVVLCWHSRIHFPSDAVAAVTKTALPRGHLLRDLLEPHFYTQLALNFAVLYVNKSVLHNSQREIYTPFLHTKESIFEFNCAGYEGIEGNSAFPPYRFWFEPPDGETEYSVFLKGLYGVVLAYVERALQPLPKNDPLTAAWANHLHTHLPGFPSSEEIFQGDTLARTVASVITNVGIIHSADHCSYGRIPIERAPLRMRVPPPVPGMKLTGRERFVTYEDVFRQALAKEMYFEPTTLRRMIDVHEEHRGRPLEPLARQFGEELKQKYWDMGIVKFISLEEIASSMQY